MAEKPAQTQENAPARSPETEPRPQATKPLAGLLGNRKLDLTIEEVEERISPSETNVFDK